VGCGVLADVCRAGGEEETAGEGGEVRGVSAHASNRGWEWQVALALKRGLAFVVVVVDTVTHLSHLLLALCTLCAPLRNPLLPTCSRGVSGPPFPHWRPRLSLHWLLLMGLEAASGHRGCWKDVAGITV